MQGLSTCRPHSNIHASAKLGSGRGCQMTRLLHAGETKDGYCQPLEQAEVVRPGSDVTILCYSRMRYVVMQAVANLEKEGFNPEVGLGSSVGRCGL